MCVKQQCDPRSQLRRVFPQPNGGRQSRSWPLGGKVGQSDESFRVTIATRQLGCRGVGEQFLVKAHATSDEPEQRLRPEYYIQHAAEGEPMQVELLVEQPSFERIMLFYKPSLERIGITVSVRTIDSSQYENRLRQWDFDIIIASWRQSLSPGNEQRDFWGSQAADIPGSRNLIGIKNPAVDEMIEKVIFATSREEVVAATKALDRVLLWNYYVVPQWTYPYVRTARWDRFGRPETMPKYGQSAFPMIWWWDKDKAAKIRS